MTESSINNTIRILSIKYGTSVDGSGLRTSLYCAGCENRCAGCHNPQSWDEHGGDPMPVDELFRLIEEADMNVTFTGGDPMLHPEGFTALARLIKERTGKTIWCYTGYRFEDLILHPQRKALLEWCDVLVDSPFLLAERDLSLPFRGSRNQRLINVQASLKSGELIMYIPFQ